MMLLFRFLTEDKIVYETFLDIVFDIRHFAFCVFKMPLDHARELFNPFDNHDDVIHRNKNSDSHEYERDRGDKEENIRFD